MPIPRLIFQTPTLESCKLKIKMRSVQMAKATIQMAILMLVAIPLKAGPGDVTRMLLRRTPSRFVSRQQLKKIDAFWRPKQRAGCNLEIQGHMAIIANKSQVLRQKFLDAKSRQGDQKAKVIIDFE